MDDIVCVHGRRLLESCPGCPEGRREYVPGPAFPKPSRFELDPLIRAPGAIPGGGSLVSAVAMRKFETGATRNTDDGKLDFEGFLSPAVLRRFAEYMHKNRVQADGQLRAADNWQKGIPKDAYMKSGMRHFFDWWENHRGVSNADLEEALCALFFNVQGYLFEVLKEKK